ncbi:hypothetical protein [Roseovarius sp. ZX-A-9]|uniref:hypothetical protein n=1 Tax=Roseovarius sp. ZX-A-9 TaxID=3014783 RepID=UPI00232D7CB5|nr:hypothetical protein [Roseovarius sp. ZX-A-9]MDX1785830.1 hypothetical protein [Roseovarius sp.]
MRFWLIALCAMFALSGCAAERVWATDEEVSRAAYSYDGPTRLTLFTMVNNRTGNGAHTSLMINGNQRVIFDPAGSFKHETIPERNDVLYGITPPVVDVYTRYHARKTYHVRIQTLDVSPEVAQRAIALVQNYGAVPAAQCAKSTSEIMAQLFPGQIVAGWYPKKLAEQFARVPGVTEKVLHEYDDDDNSKVLAEWDPSKWDKETL